MNNYSETPTPKPFIRRGRNSIPLLLLFAVFAAGCGTDSGRQLATPTTQPTTSTTVAPVDDTTSTTQPVDRSTTMPDEVTVETTETESTIPDTDSTGDYPTTQPSKTGTPADTTTTTTTVTVDNTVDGTTTTKPAVTTTETAVTTQPPTTTTVSATTTVPTTPTTTVDPDVELNKQTALERNRNRQCQAGENQWDNYVKVDRFVSETDDGCRLKECGVTRFRFEDTGRCSAWHDEPRRDVKCPVATNDGIIWETIEFRPTGESRPTFQITSNGLGITGWGATADGALNYELPSFPGSGDSHYAEFVLADNRHYDKDWFAKQLKEEEYPYTTTLNVALHLYPEGQNQVTWVIVEDTIAVEGEWTTDVVKSLEYVYGWVINKASFNVSLLGNGCWALRFVPVS